MKMQILITDLYTFLIELEENLSKYQDILSLVITPFILVT